MPNTPNRDSHIENPRNPEEIKSENQRRLMILFQKLSSDLKAEVDGDTLVFISAPQTAQLFDSNGTKFNATLRLKGDVEKKQNWHLVTIDLDGKNIEDHIALRIYTISQPSDGALLFESTLKVFKPYLQLGIGSSILESEELLQFSIANKIRSIMPFNRIRKVITDESDDGWTSRYFDKKPDWKRGSVIDRKGHEHYTYTITYEFNNSPNPKKRE